MVVVVAVDVVVVVVVVVDVIAVVVVVVVAVAVVGVVVVIGEVVLGNVESRKGRGTTSDLFVSTTIWQSWSGTDSMSPGFITVLISLLVPHHFPGVTFRTWREDAKPKKPGRRSHHA